MLITGLKQYMTVLPMSSISSSSDMLYLAKSLLRTRIYEENKQEKIKVTDSY